MRVKEYACVIWHISHTTTEWGRWRQKRWGKDPALLEAVLVHFAFRYSSVGLDGSPRRLMTIAMPIAASRSCVSSSNRPITSCCSSSERDRNARTKTSTHACLSPRFATSPRPLDLSRPDYSGFCSSNWTNLAGVMILSPDLCATSGFPRKCLSPVTR